MECETVNEPRTFAEEAELEERTAARKERQQEFAEALAVKAVEDFGKAFPGYIDADPTSRAGTAEWIAETLMEIAS